MVVLIVVKLSTARLFQLNRVLTEAIDQVLAAQIASGKPLGIIVAGHNGSGKSTMWRDHLSEKLQIPLVNADRMMLSILPEVADLLDLPTWALTLRDRNGAWMRVAQLGVEAFVAQAMIQQVPFAMETVFSDWEPQTDGTIRSKIQKIQQLQNEGYFVLLCFVGLSNVELSIARVLTRVVSGGHGVDEAKLRKRFPKTQLAINKASLIADASIMLDNSLGQEEAFRVCRIQMADAELYDLRRDAATAPAILEWMEIVVPLVE
jgi:predicted ABC-type ATPase